MVPVFKDPKRHGVENYRMCFFCRLPTLFAYVETDVPICKPCSEVIEQDDLPSLRTYNRMCSILEARRRL